MARFAYGRHTAKVAIGTYPDDDSYPVGTNEWNEDINNLGMLGFTSVEGTCATNVVTLTGNAVANTGLSSVIRIDGQGDAADDLDGITIAQTNEYDLLYLFAENSGRAITVQHASGNVSTGKIYLLAGTGTKALSTTTPMLVIRKGNDWYEYGGGAQTTPTDIDIVANNSANETVYPTFVDGATGTQGLESDTGLTYNPSTGLLTSALFAGALTGNVTGDASGSSGSCTGNAATATLATTVTITDNESTNESNSIIFTAGGAQTGGSLGLESDGTCTYNPSTGKITATGFVGALTGDVTGNVTGNTSGTALTVTQAAQSAITSVGTLTGLTMDGALAMGGNDITNGGVIYLTEQAEAEADVAGKGQIWVDTATPNKLFFTDDVGTDFDLTAGGGATLLHTFSNSTTTSSSQTGIAFAAGTAVGTQASGAGDRDIYVRKIDTNNEGVFALIHKNGAIVEAQLA